MILQSGRAVGSAGPVSRTPRDAAIDFWRGVILCTIFVNHVPGNVFEQLTPRNFGFSDSSEAFVFISGVSLAMAYGGRFAPGRRSATIIALGRRAVKLYAAHIGLSLVGLLVFATGAALFVGADLMGVHGRDLVVEDPSAAFAGLMVLGHQFGYFNILPLYVLLVAAVPALLWLNQFGRWTMLGGSAILYGVTRLFELNIPTWPMRGGWFLDPFAWQLMMALGLAVGFARREAVHTTNRVLLGIAVTILTLALIVTTNAFGLRPSLYDTVRGWTDLDKTMLGVGRIAHFLALAYVVAALGLAARLRATPAFAAFALLGRHGLAVFLMLSVLAALGQVLTQGLGHTLFLDATVIGGGLALLYGAARVLDLSGPLEAAEVTTAPRLR